MLLPDAIRSGRPALVSDAPLSAAVRERWSHLAYLREAHPEAPVQVSLTDNGHLQGTVEAHDSTSMAFGRTFLGQIHEAADDGQWEPRASKLHFHLAQCPLAALPCLKKDAPPPRCLPCDPVRSNLWFAIGANISSLHYDCWHNLLQVARGRKRVFLLPPRCTRALCPRPAHGASANHSQLSDDQVLAACPDEAIILEVGPGETLFIPEGWWHRVESPEPITVALNYWWCAEAPPLGDVSMAAYTLRRSFDLLVREEQQRLRYLAEKGAPAAPPTSCETESDPAQQQALTNRAAREEGVGALHAASSAGGVSGVRLALQAGMEVDLTARDGPGGSSSPPPCCAACGLQTPRPPLGESELLHAAEGGERQLLAWLSASEPQTVAWCLGACATSAPLRVRSMLLDAFSPETAFALGESLDAALHVPCHSCAEQAQRWVDAAFDVAGEGARAHVLALSNKLLELAAANVLAGTLGLRGPVIVQGCPSGNT